MRKIVSLFRATGWSYGAVAKFARVAVDDLLKVGSEARSNAMRFFSRVVTAFEKTRSGAFSDLSVPKQVLYAKRLCMRLGQAAKNGLKSLPKQSDIGKVFPFSTDPERCDLSPELLAAKQEIGRRTLESKDYYRELTGSPFKEKADAVLNVLSHIGFGGMSHGSLSTPVHESIATGANRAGAKSNSGEGGMHPDRIATEKNSAVVQVASGRFGVDLSYLLAADEVQIKLAQGAKPGEGGELPGWKNVEIIATIRGVKKHITLVSPPPNHDLYSIEDLFLLIHAIKSVKPMPVGVKLVSDIDVPLVALGAAKAGADVIEITSGKDAGTGAAKFSSIFNTGFPWEVGIALTHQLLMDAGVRQQVRLVASGGIVTGSEMVKAFLFGADEVSEGVPAMVSLGCRMLRQCHKSRNLSIEDVRRSMAVFVKEKDFGEGEAFDMDAYTEAVNAFSDRVYDELIKGGYILDNGNVVADRFEFKVNPKDNLHHAQRQDFTYDPQFMTDSSDKEDVITKMLQLLYDAKGGCTYNIATQDSRYALNYDGKVDAVEDLLFMQAMSVVNQLEALGLKSVDDAVGRANDYLDIRPTEAGQSPIHGLDGLLAQYRKEVFSRQLLRSPLSIPNEKDLEVISALQSHIDSGCGDAFSCVVDLSERDVSFGAAISSYCLYHAIDIPVHIVVRGVAPQNLGVWLGENISISVHNSGNDHVGKGLSGGVLTFMNPSPESPLSLVVGNSVAYGATSGNIYIDGDAGTRLAVRNTGANIVVSGDVGTYSAEFMTGGNIVVLGELGAFPCEGMSGGQFFYLESSDSNNAQIMAGKRTSPVTDLAVQTQLLGLLTDFYTNTYSNKADYIIKNWEQMKMQCRVYDPTALDDIILGDIKHKRVSDAYVLKNDSNLGMAFAQAKIDGKEVSSDRSICFTGKAGDRFAVFLPEGQCWQLAGGAGDFLGYGMAGTGVFTGANLEPFRSGYGAFTGAEASSRVFVDGYVGRSSFRDFSGMALVRSVGEESFKGLRASARVAVFGKVDGLIGEDMSDEAELYIDLNENPGFETYCDEVGDVTAVSSTISASFREDINLRSTIDSIFDGRRWARVTKEVYNRMKSDRVASLVVSQAGDRLDEKIAAGWTADAYMDIVMGMVATGLDEPTYSMGDQRPLDMEGPTGFADIQHYVRQSFAQETRPPICYKRERDKFTTDVRIGQGKFNLYDYFFEGKVRSGCKIESPLLSSDELSKIRSLDDSDDEKQHLASAVLDMTFDASQGEAGLRVALDRLRAQARSFVENEGKRIIILSHKSGAVGDRALIPSYLAAAVVNKLGLDCDVLVETAELITPHMFDLITNVGGAYGVCPYLLEESIQGADYTKQYRGHKLLNGDEAFANYRQALVNSWKRIMGKDGMCTGSARVGAKLASGFMLDEELLEILGLNGVLSRFGLKHVAEAACEQFKFGQGQHSFDRHGLHRTESAGLSQKWDGSSVRDLLSSTHTVAQRRAELTPDIEDLPASLSGASMSTSSSADRSSLAQSQLDDYTAFECKSNKDNAEAVQNIRDLYTFRPLKRTVAIIGAGASAQYLARDLAKSDDIDRVVIFGNVVDGRVGYAVAPDHSGPRDTLSRVTDELLDDEKIEMVLWNKLDERDIEEIIERHSMTVFATGSKPRKWQAVSPATVKSGEDYRLNETGHDLVKYWSKMVAWYTGKPSKTLREGEVYNPSKHGEFLTADAGCKLIEAGEIYNQRVHGVYKNDTARACPINLDKDDFLVNGMGNVTLDILRVLSSDVDAFKDKVAQKHGHLEDSVYESLKAFHARKTPKTFTVVGHRDSPAETRFDINELRDLAKIPGVKISAYFDDEYADEVYEAGNEILQFFKERRANVGEEGVHDGVHIRFVFGTKVHQVETVDESDLRCRFVDRKGTLIDLPFLASGAGLSVGDAIFCIGSESYIPVSGLSVDSSSDSKGRIYTQLTEDGEDETVEIPFLRAVGQAVTGRGKVGDAAEHAHVVAEDIKFVISDCESKPFAAKWADERWVQSRFSDAFSKDDLSDYRAYIDAGNAPPLSQSEFTTLLYRFRRQRAGQGVIGSLPSGDTIRHLQRKVFHPVELTVDVGKGHTITQTFSGADLSLSFRDALAQMKGAPSASGAGPFSVGDIEDIGLRGTCGSQSCMECALYLADGVMYQKAKPGFINEVKSGSTFLSCAFMLKDCTAQDDPEEGDFAPKKIHLKLATIQDGEGPNLLINTRNVTQVVNEKAHGDCGVGFDSQIDASADVVSRARSTMRRYIHRGAAVGGIGDGAGLLLDVDHNVIQYMTRDAEVDGSILPDGIDYETMPYGVCQLLLPNKSRETAAYKKALADIRRKLASTYKMDVLAVLDDLTDSSVLNEVGQAEERTMIQLILRPRNYKNIAAAKTAMLESDGDDSKKAAYILIMKRFEMALNQLGMNFETVLQSSTMSAECNDVSVLSSSQYFINFKGRLRGDQVHYFKQLQSEYPGERDRPLWKSRFSLGHIRYSTTTFSKDKSAHPFFKGVVLVHNGEIISAPQIKQFLDANLSDFQSKFGISYDTTGMTDSELMDLYLGVLNMMMRFIEDEMQKRTEYNTEFRRNRMLSLPALAYILLQPQEADESPLLKFAKGRFPVAEGPFNFAIVGEMPDGRQVCVTVKDKFGFRPGVHEAEKTQGSPGFVKWYSEILNQSDGAGCAVGQQSTVKHAREGEIMVTYLDTNEQFVYNPKKHDPAMMAYLARVLEDKEFNLSDVAVPVDLAA